MSKSKLITLDLLDENLKTEIALIQGIKSRVDTIENNNGFNHTHENLIVLSLITEETLEKINNMSTSYVGNEIPNTDVWYKKLI